MRRRQFLKELLTLVAGAASTQLDVDRLLWVPGEKTIFIPSEAQKRFLASDKLMLYGIPYHATDVSTGQWLGISRVMGVSKELTEMIQLLEKDKRG